MATVRCPKCGTVNPNGQKRLLRCAQCRTELSACRYCRFYDARMMDCIHPSRPDYLRIVDAREALNCQDFASTLAGRGRRFALRITRTAVIAAVVTAIALFGFVSLYRKATEEAPPVLLRAAVSAPEECEREAGFNVKVLVQNTADQPAEEVQVVISGLSMPRLTCQYMEPPEAFAEATEKATTAWIGRIEPGDIASVEFSFAPSREGKVDLVAQVIAANMEGPQKIPIKSEVLP